MSAFMKIKLVLERNYTRVVTVPSQITLDQVHDLIQVLFDWDDDHLWEFEDSLGRRFSPHDGDDFGWSDNRGLFPPEDFHLGDVLPERGAKLKYTYDFGDNWRHVITRMTNPKERIIQCLKTTGPDGLEDVGGIDGLEESEEELHTPSVEELTKRMQALELESRPKKAGKLRQLLRLPLVS